MKEEYSRADVFIMPSIRETTGAVLLEAASNGVPVIAIDRFGGPVLFDDNSAYFYTGNKTSEYINSLKNAIVNCIECPSENYIKAQKAREIVQGQTWKKKIEKYNNIYRKVLDQ